jgi:hypothetical protein
VVIALAIVGLAGMAGLVIDGGNIFLDRRNAQNAADSAALAAALARVQGNKNPQATAIGSALQNGYNNDGVTNTVKVHIPPVSGPNKDNSEYIQVIVTSRVKTYIASLVGWREVTNTVTAVARTKPSEIKEILHGQAIVSLAPKSDCMSNVSFYLHGEATLDITGGGVFVNSNNRDCAFIQKGSGGIKINDNHYINIVGAASIQKPQLLTPGVTVGVVPLTYPPPFFMPKVGCGSELAEISPDGGSMSPGSWDEAFPPAGVHHLDAGTYCLNDGIMITEDLEGNNVVLKVEDGDVHFTGGADIILNSPNSGEFRGLLIYVPMDNKNKVVLNGGAGSNIKGTILAPASEIHINGNDSATGFHSQIIGYTIDVNGNSNVVIIYNDDQNFNTLTMPEVQLSE